MKRPAVVLRDSTLREGCDVPGVNFSPKQRLRLAAALAALGVRELEIGAPRRLAEALPLQRELRRRRLPLKASGLVFAYGDYEEQLGAARELDRADLLMPAAGRGPARLEDKARALTRALTHARELGVRDAGAGFPHATSVEPGRLRRLAEAARRAGASRLTVYDTNGRARPEELRRLVAALRGVLPVYVHCHDDLGLAAANTLAALEAGARGADVTLLGLGDRAGNCSLETMTALLDGRFRHGLRLRRLKAASDLAHAMTGLRPPLFPVTGEFAFRHVTRTHLADPALFEAFPPERVGARRGVGAPGADLPPRAAAVFAAMRARRSVRRFRPEPPGKPLLRRLLAAAQDAPSSMNGRPWSFRVLEDRGAVRELVRIKNAHAPAAKAVYTADFLLGAPLVVIVCVDERRAFGRSVENAALAAANIMNGAASLGLGTTFLCAYRDGDPSLEREIASLLRLPRGVRPRVILPLGWPA